ncbi:juvenile hormone esterase-like [Amyelois transitella]|uniref:juvenile hormone esterase-like n=1 Tax=Amyelois transitella TaxID=680683 RepID=UPI00067C6D86|nr:juvenile hormone esterase-like [Amyelois transitella]
MYKLAILLSSAVLSYAWPEAPECGIRARTEAGWVCGTRRVGDYGLLYASFRGVPYAKQPLGDLRFKELQPPEPWEGLLDATSEGPVCPQRDVLYGRLMQPRTMSEACIHANIHVPLADLPWYRYNHGRLARGLVPPRLTTFDEVNSDLNPGLPIVVFIHGGGFAFGSGDSDVYGPEYLVSKRVIVITFNYRLNVLGFLSLNSSSIPGNSGLRDMVTLLRWVRRNARGFGGDPYDVTLAGQSAGASSAHLLSLSPAAEGLFKRVWIMSGVGLPIFFSSAPTFAQFAATTFLSAMKINSTDPEAIHQQLIDAPIEQIMEVNGFMLEKFGLTTFTPVVESPHPGVTTIIDADPTVLVTKGRGKNIPMVVGFTNVECETFRQRFEKVDIITRIKENSILVVSPHLIYTTPLTVLPGLAGEIQARYFNGTVNLDKFVRLCTDQYFKYPALKLASLRRKTGGAPLYLYEFSYDDDQSVLKEGWGISYTGAAHIEDMTYVMRTNSIVGNESLYSALKKEDRRTKMKDWMTTLFTNFVQTSNPNRNEDETTGYWLSVNSYQLLYTEIAGPDASYSTSLTQELLDIKMFFDSIFQRVTG